MITEWIKLNLFKIALLFLTISLVANVFLFTWKGINITKNYITQNHQEQFQGQLQFNMWMSQGNTVIWRSELFGNERGAISKLNSLPPQYSYFSKVAWCGSGMYVVFWPEFMTTKEQK